MVRTSLVRYSADVWKRLNSHVSLSSLMMKLLPAHPNSWKESRVERQPCWTEMWRWPHLHSLALWQPRGGYDRIDTYLTYQEESDYLALLKRGKHKKTERSRYTRLAIVEPLRKRLLCGDIVLVKTGWYPENHRATGDRQTSLEVPAPSLKRYLTLQKWLHLSEYQCSHF